MDICADRILYVCQIRRHALCSFLVHVDRLYFSAGNGYLRFDFVFLDINMPDRFQYPDLRDLVPEFFRFTVDRLQDPTAGRRGRHVIRYPVQPRVRSCEARELPPYCHFCFDHKMFSLFGSVIPRPSVYPLFTSISSQFVS